jgi:hypothetical protein
LESKSLFKIKIFVSIGICAILLLGCGTANKNETPTGVIGTESTDQTSYPSPNELPTLPDVNTPYPSPADGSQGSTVSSTQTYFVTELVVPTPSSGMAVITGILLGSGNSESPFVTSIYLSSAILAETTAATPEVKYSEQTDPIAVQDKNTGQFVFSNVSPGQYALVIWTQNGGSPLTDESGNIIVFSVGADETKDLGSLHVP